MVKFSDTFRVIRSGAAIPTGIASVGKETGPRRRETRVRRLRTRSRCQLKRALNQLANRFRFGSHDGSVVNPVENMEIKFAWVFQHPGQSVENREEEVSENGIGEQQLEPAAELPVQTESAAQQRLRNSTAVHPRAHAQPIQARTRTVLAHGRVRFFTVADVDHPPPQHVR